MWSDSGDAHSRPTRNRREFLTDAFCGFGSLAFTGNRK